MFTCISDAHSTIPHSHHFTPLLRMTHQTSTTATSEVPGIFVDLHAVADDELGPDGPWERGLGLRLLPHGLLWRVMPVQVLDGPATRALERKMRSNEEAVKKNKKQDDRIDVDSGKVEVETTSPPIC